MRMPIIAGNWKMYKTLDEAITFTRDLIPALDPLAGAERVICPPYISIPAVHDLLAGTSIQVGAQDLHAEIAGAFTSSVSASMLEGLADYVIVGHSEVRQYLCDTDARINQKIKAALRHNIRPILAVGESLAQNDAGETTTFIDGQIRGALAGIPLEALPNMVIAYEPIWAIGTGRSATGAQANAVIGGIRQTLAVLYGVSAAQEMRIQYGGSVKPSNMREFMSQPEIDGALVGGASLSVDDFVALTRIAIEAKSGA